MGGVIDLIYNVILLCVILFSNKMIPHQYRSAIDLFKYAVSVLVFGFKGLVVSFKNELARISDGAKNVQKFFPIYITVTGHQMVVTLLAVVVLNVQGNRNDLALEKLSAGNIVSVGVTRVIAPTEIW